MPLPRITNFCPICGDKLRGRYDKRFCSNRCRSIYFRRKQQEQKPVTLNTDAILHKNWKILSQLHLTMGKRKFFIEAVRLLRMGFHSEYYTTSFENKSRKKYYYVYDFAWMDFSEKEVMIIKLNKPK